MACAMSAALSAIVARVTALALVVRHPTHTHEMLNFMLLLGHPRLTLHISNFRASLLIAGSELRSLETSSLHLGMKVPLHLAHLERRLPSLTSMLKACRTSCS